MTQTAETAQTAHRTPGPPRRRRILVACLVVIVLAAGVAGFFWWRAKSARPQYVTAAVTQGNIQRTVNMTGALNPLVTVQVGSYVSGTIKTLGCDYNTEVVVGQVCATIDPVPFQLIVDEDRAEVRTAEAQLTKDRAALANAKTAFERDSKLLREGTVSQETVDNDKSAYDQAVAQIGLDQAAIANKQATLKAAEVNLAYTNIASPVVGTVITRSIDVGQTVAASLQSPTLFLIGKDLTKMQVDTNVSEADVGGVRLGQKAFFSVQAFPGRVFQGEVRQIRHGPITVQNVVTYDVVVGVDNPSRLLFPGMTADTHIVTAERDGVLRVPLPAVRFTPEGFGRSRHGGGESARAEGGGAGAQPETGGGETGGTGGASSGEGTAAAPATAPPAPAGAAGAGQGTAEETGRPERPHRGAGRNRPGGPDQVNQGSQEGGPTAGGGGQAGERQRRWGQSDRGPEGAGEDSSGPGGETPWAQRRRGPRSEDKAGEGSGDAPSGAETAQAEGGAEAGSGRRHQRRPGGPDSGTPEAGGERRHGWAERHGAEAGGSAEATQTAVPDGTGKRRHRPGDNSQAAPGGTGQGEGRRFRQGGGPSAVAGGPPGGGGDWGGRGGWGRNRGGRPGAGERRGRIWVLQKDGGLRPVDVTLGLDDGTLIEVSGKGLAPGDKVVVNEVGREERRRAGGGSPFNLNPGAGGGFRQGGPGGGGPPGGPRP